LLVKGNFEPWLNSAEAVLPAQRRVVDTRSNEDVEQLAGDSPGRLGESSGDSSRLPIEPINELLAIPQRNRLETSSLQRRASSGDRTSGHSANRTCPNAQLRNAKAMVAKLKVVHDPQCIVLAAWELTTWNIERAPGRCPADAVVMTG